MKTRHKILIVVGIVTLGFGLINIFWYAPHSLTLVFYNQPFPFPHLQDVEIHEDGGKGISITYEPFNSAIQYPYWLAWSLSLYTGIAIFGGFFLKKVFEANVRQ